MKKINFKSLLVVVVIAISICSFTFLNHVEKADVNKKLASTQTEEVSLPDVSFLSDIATFILDNLPAD